MTFARFPLWLCFVGYVYAATNIEYTTFHSNAQLGTKLRYVSDSGLCETTPVSTKNTAM